MAVVENLPGPETERPIGFGRKGSKVLITLETVAADEKDAQAAIEASVGRLLAIVSGCR